MASNTPNIGLYKVNPATDGNLTFNIETMLNQNWDKIDAEIGNMPKKDGTLQAGLNAEKVGGKTVSELAPAIHTHIKADITDFAHSHNINEITNLSTANVDTVDGKHASDFVLKAGDTMTGTLTAQKFLANNNVVIDGTDPYGAIEIGKNSSGTPHIDFHSGSTNVDYDSRIIASGGTGVDGQGNLTIISSLLSVNSNLKVFNNDVWHWGNLKINKGTYIGDGTNGRLINIGFQPVLVILGQSNYGYHTILTNAGLTKWGIGSNARNHLVANGFNVYESDLGECINTSGATFYYIAIGV